jgi:hypothetical protein
MYDFERQRGTLMTLIGQIYTDFFR